MKSNLKMPNCKYKDYSKPLLISENISVKIPNENNDISFSIPIDKNKCMEIIDAWKDNSLKNKEIIPNNINNLNSKRKNIVICFGFWRLPLPRLSIASF